MKKDLIVKSFSGEPDENGNYHIKGIASTEQFDREGQKLMLDNIDYSYIDNNMSWVKYEHDKSPDSYVGTLDKAEVIKSKDGVRQLWIEGRISPASESGRKVIELMKACKKLGRNVMLSIEAGVIEWADKTKTVAKSILLKHASITLDPMNLGTVAVFKSMDGEVEKELILDLKDEENSQRIQVSVDGEINIIQIQKSLSNSDVIEHLQKSFNFKSLEDAVKAVAHVNLLNEKMFNMKEVTQENLKEVTDKLISEMEQVEKSTDKAQDKPIEEAKSDEVVEKAEDVVKSNDKPEIDYKEIIGDLLKSKEEGSDDLRKSLYEALKGEFEEPVKEEPKEVKTEEVVKSAMDKLLAKIEEYKASTDAKLDKVAATPVQKSVSTFDRPGDEVQKSNDSSDPNVINIEENRMRTVDILCDLFKSTGNRKLTQASGFIEHGYPLERVPNLQEVKDFVKEKTNIVLN